MEKKITDAFLGKLKGLSYRELTSYRPYYEAALICDNIKELESLFLALEIQLIRWNIPLKGAREKRLKIVKLFKSSKAKDKRNDKINQLINAEKNGSHNAAFGFDNVSFMQILPEGYEIIDGTIFKTSGKKPVAICSDKVHIEALIEDVDTQCRYLRIETDGDQNECNQIFLSEDVYDGKVLKALNNAKPVVHPRRLSDLGEFFYYSIQSRYEDFEQYKSFQCSRIGWVDENYDRFVPYDTDITYTAENQKLYQKEYLSVVNSEYSGNSKGWINLIRPYRDESHMIFRIVLAASFSSVLVKPLSGLTYMLHLWGESEFGKSVALKAAASVWANPDENAGYVKTFNATSNGLEMALQFYGNLPLFIDELQASKLNNEKLIYALSEGIPKVRGKSQGGMMQQSGWTNAIISTGEHPLATYKDNGGAQNRVIDLLVESDIVSSDKEIINEFCEGYKTHYGYIGEQYVKHLTENYGIDHARDIYGEYVKELHDRVTGKQASAAALILTADTLIDEWFFQDGIRITAEDMIPYLRTKADIDINEKAHEAFKDWILSNRGYFDNKKAKYTLHGGKAVYAILTSNFRVIFSSLGYDPEAYFNWAVRKGYAPRGSDRRLATRYTFEINGSKKQMNCYAIYDWDVDKKEDADVNEEMIKAT